MEGRLTDFIHLINFCSMSNEDLGCFPLLMININMERRPVTFPVTNISIGQHFLHDIEVPMCTCILEGAQMNKGYAPQVPGQQSLATISNLFARFWYLTLHDVHLQYKCL